MILPWPRHCPQVVTVANEPRKEACWRRTWPLPPHILQVSGAVPFFAPEPLQVSQICWCEIEMVLDVPWAASRKDKSITFDKSSPLDGP